MRAAGFVAFFCLVGGEVKAVLQESHTWVGALVPTEEVEDTVLCVP